MSAKHQPVLDKNLAPIGPANCIQCLGLWSGKGSYGISKLQFCTGWSSVCDADAGFWACPESSAALGEFNMILMLPGPIDRSLVFLDSDPPAIQAERPHPRKIDSIVPGSTNWRPPPLPIKTFIWHRSEEFQKPQPLLVSKKVLQYTSNLYGSTPPICIAALSWLLGLEERETQQYTSHLYCSTLHLYDSTPPIRTAVLLRKYRGLESPESSWIEEVVRLAILDAAFLLTVRSFLLTVELFYLQLRILAFLLKLELFCLQF